MYRNFNWANPALHLKAKKLFCLSHPDGSYCTGFQQIACFYYKLVFYKTA